MYVVCSMTAAAFQDAAACAQVCEGSSATHAVCFRGPNTTSGVRIKEETKERSLLIMTAMSRSVRGIYEKELSRHDLYLELFVWSFWLCMVKYH